MITEFLIKFTGIRPAHPDGELAFAVSMLRMQASNFGYFIERGTAIWRDPTDKHVLWAKWVMTGTDAFKHLLNKDPRVNEYDTVDNLRQALAREPEVVKLWASDRRSSCRCKKGASSPLTLFCTPISLYPPLLCEACKEGVLPMYKLPLSPRTAVLLSDWNKLSKAMFLLSELRNINPKDWVEPFIEDQGKPGSSFRNLTSKLKRLVAAETGRKVSAQWRPFHILNP